MRLKFCDSIAGPSWVYRYGEIHDVPEPDASRYLAHGLAVLADPLPEPETVPASEPAERALPRRRKGAESA